MKTLSGICKDTLDNFLGRSRKLVHFFMSSKGYQPIDPPAWSDELTCPFCGESRFFLCMIDKDKRAWGCGRVCLGSKLPFSVDAVSIQPIVIRSLEWPLFCEINGIGNIHHDVRFEEIRQSQGKIDYMLKFASKPKGIILMRGDPGTGKTYAAMGVCEFYTRKSELCIFTTQRKMSSDWHLSASDGLNNYIRSITNTPLLVVDDFGTGEPTVKFLEFFMDLINTRMQWDNRGTIITTNLDKQKLNKFCGQALSDRFLTGQIFEFNGETRRKQIIL